jgi:hypothetical protein
MRGVGADEARKSFGRSASAGGVVAFVLLASALLPAGVRAQAALPNPSPPSAESLQQMHQELEALKAEEAEARAAAQERARRIDALVQQLGAAASEPSPAPPVKLPPAPVEVAGVKPERGEVVASKGFTVRIFGKAVLDAIYNTARAQAPGNPVFLVPKFEGGFSQHTMDLNARNSQLGVAFTGPDIGEFHSGGRISAVFFDNTNLFADNNGFLLTQSYGELFNDRWRFAAGLQLDVVAPAVPTVLPFAIDGAPIGNNIKGQIRVERFLPVGSDSLFTFQGALSEPLTTAKTPDVSLDEDNGKPNLEGRIAFGSGKPAPVGIGLLTQRPWEVGVSGMIGQLRRTSLPSDPAPRRVVSDVWLAAVDYQLNLARLFGVGPDFGLKGELYTGQGLGNYGGGILQSLDAVTWKAIRTNGGWVEGFVYLTPGVHNHTGIFIDNPNDDDITALPNTLFGRTYNSAVYNTLIWDLDRAYRIAVEATYRKTEYKDPIPTGRLTNEGFGLHTQFAWTF